MSTVRAAGGNGARLLRWVNPLVGGPWPPVQVALPQDARAEGVEPSWPLGFLHTVNQAQSCVLHLCLQIPDSSSSAATGMMSVYRIG